jgi:hypothetical protein
MTMLSRRATFALATSAAALAAPQRRNPNSETTPSDALGDLDATGVAARIRSSDITPARSA